MTEKRVFWYFILASSSVIYIKYLKNDYLNNIFGSVLFWNNYALVYLNKQIIFRRISLLFSC